jgi:hypothetical protein
MIELITDNCSLITDKAMTLKEQLIKEIEQTPDTLLTELLDFLLFIKERHTEIEITEEEQANIIASESAYQAGDYLTLEEYEATQA